MKQQRHSDKAKHPSSELLQTAWWDTIGTPLGNMLACATNEGLCILEFIKENDTNSEPVGLEKSLCCVISRGQNDHIRQLKQELAEYFNGSRISFGVTLNPVGTVFQKAVWQNLQQIPYGNCITYREQAVSMGNEKAIRAVAAANGRNRIAIIIPCHRVIGSNGRLTGYAGGLDRKRWLLEFEMRKSGNFLIQPHFHHHLFNQ